MSASTAIIPDEPGGRIANRHLMLFLPFGLYVVGAISFFRWQILSKFDLIFGDRGDARLVVFLHEHVYRWLYVRSGLLSPPFFFDQTKTLGYSDAFLLDQVIYAPLRLLGADPLLATSLIAVTLSPVAFLFLYLFLRRLDVSIPMASLAAFIFTFANNLFLKSGHLQHFTVYYIPIIAYCGLLAISDVHRRPVRAYVLGAFAAGLYGLLFSTGYYMAWFFGIALLIFTPIFVCLAWPEVRAWWSRRPGRVLGLGLAASLSFLAALSIFATIYAPVLAIGAARPFGDYLVYAPKPNDIVNVGMENLVWSGLIRSLHLVGDDRLGNGELRIALTPTVQILLLASAVLAFRPRFWPAGYFGRLSRAFVIASAIVCALFFVLTIKIGSFSLFHLLYAMVPGAKAIRAGYRGMVVADLFAVTAIGLTFGRVFRSSWQRPHTFLRLGQSTALTALLSLAAIEQVNLARPAFLSRKFEGEHMAALGSAPRECRSFYAAPQADRAPFEVQIDAMMVALAQRLPTINGYSGLVPPGWDFYDTNAADYEQRARLWAIKHGIASGLCRIDMDGAWTTVPADRDWSCTAGGCVHPIPLGSSHEFDIDLAQGGNGASFVDDHWLAPEPGGRWTGAAQAALSLSVGAPRDLGVALSIHALLSAGAPNQSVWIEANRCRIVGVALDLALGPEPRTISGIIPANCIDADGKILLRINTDRVRSPKEIGINEDTRQLGVMVERVLIRELNRPDK